MNRFIATILITVQIVAMFPQAVFALITPLSLDSAGLCNTSALEDAITKKNSALAQLNATSFFAAGQRRIVENNYEVMLEQVGKEFNLISDTDCKKSFLAQVGLGTPFEDVSVEDVNATTILQLEIETRKKIADVVVASVMHQIHEHYQQALNQLLMAKVLRQHPDQLTGLSQRLFDQWAKSGTVITKSLQQQADAYARLLSLKDIVDLSALDENIQTAKTYVVTTRLVSTAMDEQVPWDADALTNPSVLFGGELSADNQQMNQLYQRTFMDTLRSLYGIIVDNGDVKQESELIELSYYYVSRDFENQSIVQSIADQHVNNEKEVPLGLSAIALANTIQQRIVNGAPKSEASRRIQFYAKANDDWARAKTNLSYLMLGGAFIPLVSLPTWALRAQMVYAALTDMVAYGGLSLTEGALNDYFEREPNVGEKVVAELAKIGLSIPTGAVLRLGMSKASDAMMAAATGSFRNNKQGQLLFSTRYSFEPEESLFSRFKRQSTKLVEDAISLVSSETRWNAATIIKRLRTSGWESVISTKGIFKGQKFSKALLANLGLKPFRSIDVEGETFIFSRIFKAGSDRYAAYLYVPVGKAEFEIVPVYTSGSQGVWRILPARSESGSFFKVANVENALDLVSELQEFLSNNIGKDKAFMQSAKFEDGFFAVEGPTPVYDYSMEEQRIYWAGSSDKIYEKVINDPLTLDLNTVGRSTPDPGSIGKSITSEQEPTPFIVRQWTRPSVSYGSLTFRQYLSKNGALRYIIATTPEGNSFIASIEDASSPVTTLGIRSGFIKAPYLMTPGVEYEENGSIVKWVKDNYPSELQGNSYGKSIRPIETDATGRYYPTWSYVERIPLMQKFSTTLGGQIVNSESAEQFLDKIYQLGTIDDSAGTRWPAQTLINHILGVVRNQKYKYYQQFDTIPRIYGIRATARKFATALIGERP